MFIVNSDSLQLPPPFWMHPQSAVICSKLTIETLEQGMQYVQNPIGVVLVSLLLTLNIFHTLF